MSVFTSNRDRRWNLRNVQMGLWNATATAAPPEFFTALNHITAYLYGNRGDTTAPMTVGGIPHTAATMLNDLRYCK